MPRVVPGQVVAFIDEAYGAEPQVRFSPLDFNNGPTIEAITNLVDHIPVELIALDTNDYSTVAATPSAVSNRGRIR